MIDSHISWQADFQQQKEPNLDGWKRCGDEDIETRGPSSLGTNLPRAVPREKGKGPNSITIVAKFQFLDK